MDLNDLDSNTNCQCFKKLREINNENKEKSKGKYLADFDGLLSNSLIIVFIFTFTHITIYIGLVVTNNKKIPLNHLENIKIKLAHELIR